MDITDVNKTDLYKKKVAQAQAKKKMAAKDDGRGVSYKQVQKDKKAGKFYGFDGMKGQTGPEAKLKGK